MKRTALTLIMTICFSLGSPLVSAAQAAALENQLTGILLSSAGVKVQELASLTRQLDPSNYNSDALRALLVQAAIAKAGGMTAGGELGKAAIQTATSQVETMVRNEVSQQLSERLKSYEQEFTVLSTLLNLNQTLAPQASVNSGALPGSPQQYARILDMTATAYAPGPLDNGKWGDLTYMGGKVRKGVAAVDPAVIPMGTKLWIEGYGEAIAEDQGSAIKGNRIDLAFNNRAEALDYGIQPVKVYVLK